MDHLFDMALEVSEFSLEGEQTFEVDGSSVSVSVEHHPFKLPSGQRKPLLAMRYGDELRLFADIVDETQLPPHLYVVTNRQKLFFFGGKFFLIGDLSESSFRVLASERLDVLPELRFVKFEQLPGSCLAIIYECGLIVLDADLRLLTFEKRVVNDQYLAFDDGLFKFEKDNGDRYSIKFESEINADF